MGPIRSTRRGLGGVFRLSGRAGWAEYWWFVLTGGVLSLTLSWGWGGGAVDAYVDGMRQGLEGAALQAHVAAAPQGALKGALLAALEPVADEAARLIVLALFAVVWAWLTLAGTTAAVRRLHDVGRSGWWIGWPIPVGAGAGVMAATAPQLLLMLALPAAIMFMVVSLVTLVFLLLPGEPGQNRFGPGRTEAARPAPTARAALDIPAVQPMSADELRALRQSRMRQA
jgi:uncharacterized membrane protein YhaH (DUF805 family)